MQTPTSFSFTDTPCPKAFPCSGAYRGTIILDSSDSKLPPSGPNERALRPLPAGTGRSVARASRPLGRGHPARGGSGTLPQQRARCPRSQRFIMAEMIKGGWRIHRFPMYVPVVGDADINGYVCATRELGFRSGVR